jgi:predicted ribosomally synthesized peptide with SipW-like signal peptide
MTRSRKLLRSLLVVAVIAGLTTYGTYSAFSATTVNDGNQIQAGTVLLGDNDSNGVLYNEPNLAPGSPVTKCITVTYTGTLPSAVKLYVPTAPSGTLAPYVNVLVEAGSKSSAGMECTGFAKDRDVYTGKLSQLVANHTSFANGISDNPAGETQWTAAKGTVSYRFTVSVEDTNDAAGKSVGAHTFKWEAQSK